MVSIIFYALQFQEKNLLSFQYKFVFSGKLELRKQQTALCGKLKYFERVKRIEVGHLN